MPPFWTTFSADFDDDGGEGQLLVVTLVCRDRRTVCAQQSKGSRSAGQ